MSLVVLELINVAVPEDHPELGDPRSLESGVAMIPVVDEKPPGGVFDDQRRQGFGVAQAISQFNHPTIPRFCRLSEAHLWLRAAGTAQPGQRNLDRTAPEALHELKPGGEIRVPARTQ